MGYLTRMALVFTQFGANLFDQLENIAYRVVLRRPHIGVDFAFKNSVCVATKPLC
jgi:hypothetical protein